MANSSALIFKVVAEKNLAMRKPDGMGADVCRPNAPSKFPSSRCARPSAES